MSGIKHTSDSKYALELAGSLGLRMTSGYRDPVHNAKIGGSSKSDHIKGQAYDFAGTRNQMLSLADKLHKSGRFKQVIFDNRDYKTGKYIGGHQDHVHVAWNATSSSPDKSISQGDKGGIVAAIQKLLGGINVDGLFGNETDEAVKAFQEKHKLTVDGLVGNNTWNVLTGGGGIFFSR